MGCILSLLNEGDVLFEGPLTSRRFMKVAMNFVVRSVAQTAWRGEGSALLGACTELLRRGGLAVKAVSSFNGLLRLVTSFGRCSDTFQELWEDFSVIL